MAVFGKRISALEWLFSKISNLSERKSIIKQAFQYAAYQGNIEVLNYFFQKTSDPDEQRSIMQEAFQYAAYQGNIEVLNYFFQKTSDPDKQRSIMRADENRAFIYAAENGKLDALKWLFEKNFNDIFFLLNLINYKSYSFVEKVARNGHTHILEWLLTFDPNKENILQTAFLEATVYGNVNVLEYVFNYITEPGKKDGILHLYENRPIKQAILNGELAALEWLLSNIKDQKNTIINIFLNHTDNLIAKLVKNKHISILERLFEFVIDDNKKFDTFFHNLQKAVEPEIRGTLPDKDNFRTLIKQRVKLREIGFDALKIEDAIKLFKYTRNYMATAKKPLASIANSLNDNRHESDLLSSDSVRYVIAITAINGQIVTNLSLEESLYVLKAMEDLTQNPEQAKSENNIIAQTNFLTRLYAKLDKKEIEISQPHIWQTRTTTAAFALSTAAGVAAVTTGSLIASSLSLTAITVLSLSNPILLLASALIICTIISALSAYATKEAVNMDREPTYKSFVRQLIDNIKGRDEGYLSIV